MTTSPLLELFGEHWHRSSCIVSSLLLINTSVSCLILLESFVISPREDLNWYLSSFVRKFSRSHTAGWYFVTNNNFSLDIFLFAVARVVVTAAVSPFFSLSSNKLLSAIIILENRNE